jgi:Flp pilus assembly protein TadG
MNRTTIMFAGWRTDERGNAIIEFALSFGLLFSMFTGVFQFGYVYYLYNNLESSIRGAARYASFRVYDSGTAMPSAEYLTAVQNMAVYGNPAGGGQPVAPAFTPEKVTVTVTMERNAPRWVTVAIQGYQINAVFASFGLNGKPKVTFAYMGRFAPP